MRPFVALLIALGVIACARHDDQGTAITINADGGNETGSVDAGTGEMKLNVPGFSGSIRMPRIQLTADNFDMNGVHLYPGSKITGMDMRDGKGGDGGSVQVRFTSPAPPATVRDWLAERLNKASFSVTPSGDGLTGTTDDHRPFRLVLEPAGQAASSGTLAIG